MKNVVRRALKRQNRLTGLLKLFAIAFISAPHMVPAAYALASEDGETTKHLMIKDGMDMLGLASRLGGWHPFV